MTKLIQYQTLLFSHDRYTYLQKSKSKMKWAENLLYL